MFLHLLLDLSLFQKRDKLQCRTEIGMPVRGFIERKGDKRLLAAVNQLDDVYVAFAGRGPPEGERVIFCQALEHGAVCDFLNAVDVFFLPTLSEGSCNEIVEATECCC